ncbi:hypothetical protein [Streptomyces erythrochromogenes]|uniref:hypothetical protein n=1 Tax=Streptomyces erythrochromogenes TaxID=285574 RepID=UPI0004CD7DF1|nr:hypothetical protein [Streptomyces erythrochromogenes]
MNVHISPLPAVLFVISSLLGYLIYKATVKTRVVPGGTGADLVGSIGSGAAIFAVLMVVFNGGLEGHDAVPPSPPAHTAESRSTAN